MGLPFKGLHVIGFNNLQKKVSMLWIDGTETAFQCPVS